MDYEKALDAAFAAARAASSAAEARMGSDRFACGFAWASISGNEPFARYCRARAKAGDRRRYGSKGHPSGWQFWNPGGSGWQNVDVKEAGARAFRDALGAYGIRVDCGSRLD